MPSQELASNFEIICKELPSFMTSSNGFKINRLYKQRLYNILKPVLTKI